MNGPEFFQTRMGQIFFDGTMPRLVREIARLNDNLERLLAAIEPAENRSDKPAAKPDGEGQR